MKFQKGGILRRSVIPDQYVEVLETNTRIYEYKIRIYRTLGGITTSETYMPVGAVESVYELDIHLTRNNRLEEILK
jgi:hypothetical protein